MSYFPTVLPVRRSALAAAATVAPEHLGIVERINRDHPHLLRHNDRAACTEFTQRVLAALPAGEEWGHLSKNAGEAGHDLPHGVRVSYDVVCHKATGRQVDIVAGGDGHPAPGGPAWQEIDPAFYRAHNVWTRQQPLFDSGTPGGGAPAKALICGMGAFPLLRALQEWPDEMRVNATFIHDRLPVKVWRCFLDVEGISHIRGSMPDPWRDAGIDGRDPRWEEWFKAALDWAGHAGEQLWCCVYGGRNHFPTLDSRRRFHDRLVRAAEGRWSAIWGLECMNEYRVNHWDEREVRDTGIDLRSKVPVGTRIALSSPRYAHSYVDDVREATAEDMAACYEDLYGGAGHSGASVVSIHKMRDARSRWADSFSYNLFMRDLLKVDGEPFGDGASAGGDTSDPQKIAADAQRTRDAGYDLRIEHPATWCIWMDRVPREYGLTQYRFIKDVPHIEETFRLLQGVYGGGTIEPGKPGEPEMPPQPYPDEPQWWTKVATAEIKKRYPGGQLNDEAFRWFARAAHRIGAGQVKEEALKTVLGELDAIVAPKPAA